MTSLKTFLLAATVAIALPAAALAQSGAGDPASGSAAGSPGDVGSAGNAPAGSINGSTNGTASATTANGGNANVGNSPAMNPVGQNGGVTADGGVSNSGLGNVGNQRGGGRGQNRSNSDLSESTGSITRNSSCADVRAKPSLYSRDIVARCM